MKHLEVLVFTKHTTTPRILNWKVSTVNDIETAIEKLQQRPYKVVAIAKEISEADKLKLNRLATVLVETISVVNYTDESDISKKVKSAYWSKHKPSDTNAYLDNSFEIKLANSIKIN